MARIRSVHPDICASQTLAGLSAELERTFVRLWTHCDDEGRCEDRPRLIKAGIYPEHDDMTWERVDEDLTGLDAAGLVLRYEAAGKRYLAVRSWGEYQHPQRARPSKIPPPPGPEHSDEPPDGSQSGPRHVREPSANGREAPNTETPREPMSSEVPRHVRDDSATVQGLELGEGEGEGEGVRDVAPTISGALALVPDAVSPPATARTDTQIVFDAWVTACGRSGRTKLDDKRRRIIRQALKAYPVDDLVDAVRGWRNSPFHAGRNESRRTYNDLGLLLRDSEHIERFRDLERYGPERTNGNRPRSADAIDRVLGPLSL